MTDLEQIFEAIRALPVEKQLRIVERVVHDVAEAQQPSAPGGRRPLGIDAGRVVIAEDFDAPLPEEIQRAFDGEL